jgi:3-methyladenine DNA glycosylase AlkD
MAAAKLPKPKAKARAPHGKADARAVVAKLRAMGSPKVRDGMARYAIPADKAVGISVGALRAYAKKLGRDHALALALWKTDLYEARMLATFVGEPDLLTPAQMDAWCRDFDSWALCDTACFGFFDRSPHAWGKVGAWAGRRDEFVKRAAFALLASLALHDEKSPDQPFLDGLDLIERAADDERNFVKKGVNWALRTIGKRNAALNAAAVGTAERLAESDSPAARWTGKDALRDLASPATARRLARRAAR